MCLIKTLLQMQIPMHELGIIEKVEITEDNIAGPVCVSAMQTLFLLASLCETHIRTAVYFIFLENILNIYKGLLTPGPSYFDDTLMWSVSLWQFNVDASKIYKFTKLIFSSILSETESICVAWTGHYNVQHLNYLNELGCAECWVLSAECVLLEEP